MTHALERLRRAREEQGLDIDALARRTRLRVHLLQAVEDGRWGDLPRGVYARAVVRAYAEAVGADPNGVVAEVAALLPEAEDPLDGMARVWGVDRKPAAETVESPPAPETAPVPAVAGGAPPAPAVGGGALSVSLRLAGAAAIDTAILSALVTPVIAATAALCGVPVATLVEAAAPAVALIALVVATLYFVLLGGIGGATPGARLVGPPQAPRVFRGTAETALRRAWELVLRESSILVVLLWPWPGPGDGGDTPVSGRSGMPWAKRVPVR